MARKSVIGVARKGAVYPIRLPADLARSWADYCERKGESQQAMIRAIMRYMIQDEVSPEVVHWIAKEIQGKQDNGEKKRVVVRLTPTEYQSIIKRAEAEGDSPQSWIVSCVRASLTKSPQFTMEVIKALWQSTFQLRAIGRNLNQITKRLHATGEFHLGVKQMERISSSVDSHRDKVGALLNASITRWVISDEKD